VCRSLGNFFAPGIPGQATWQPISGSAASGCRAWVLNRTVASGWSTPWRPAALQRRCGRSGGLEQTADPDHQWLRLSRHGLGSQRRDLGRWRQRHPAGQSRPGSQLQRDPVGAKQPTNFKPNRLHRQRQKALFSESGATCCAGSADRRPCVTNQRLRAPRQRVGPLGFAQLNSPAAMAAGSTGGTPLFRDHQRASVTG